jgi:hypothetical protein
MLVLRGDILLVRDVGAVCRCQRKTAVREHGL